MDDDDGSDPDRAAILARRQRFIALALSGLSVSCGKNGGSPTPCLDVGPAETSSADDGATTGSSGMPMPCLDIGPMTESTVDDTGTDSSDTSGTDSTGDTDTDGTSSTG